jgi:phage terminase large subunit GpA-like protein
MTAVPLVFWTPHDDKIKVTYETTPRWNGAPRRAYRWDCPCCGTYGRHRFNRFTDRVQPGKAVHPWRRAMAAARLHLLLNHGRSDHGW